ncbi:uncharacterized protein LOC113279403 [Papaver somniferum]|uniref:uncharacterized protein LOC113279403 n=1 Tax=Papaver somniferum TaxID=3469 RepID=UPI000E6FC296|nr:uncharacterized protein LOC113279403 [Papaver somniferum]
MRERGYDSSCPFCGFAVESLTHVFFDCPYAKSVWALPPGPNVSNVHSSDSFLDHYNEWTRDDSTSLSLEVAATKVWHILKERCDRVFSNKTSISISLSIQIQRFIQFWTPSRNVDQDSATVIIPSSTLPLPNRQWTIPLGYGIVIRNALGYQGARGGNCRVSSPEEAEALAVFEATKWAREKALTNFSLEGDCKNVMDYLNGMNTSITWQVQRLLDEVKKMVAEVTNF